MATFYHRRLRIIDCLMSHTACLVCWVSTVGGGCKNALGRGSVSSGYIKKLEQSILSLDIYAFYALEKLKIGSKRILRCEKGYHLH